MAVCFRGNQKGYLEEKSLVIIGPVKNPSIFTGVTKSQYKTQYIQFLTTTF
jgi:hypothetical protein